MDQSEARTRSFTGCHTCRRRHIRCDEARPTCFACQRLNIQCQGYESQLQWVTSRKHSSNGKSERHGSSFRAQLFTHDARSAMSQALVESLGEHHAIDAASELDALSLIDDKNHSLGPFSVFRVSNRVSTRGHEPKVPQSGKDLSLSPPHSSPKVSQSTSHDHVVFHSDQDNEILSTPIWSKELNLHDLDSDFLPTPFWGELAQDSNWTGFQLRGIGDSELCSAPEDLAIDQAYFQPMPMTDSPPGTLSSTVMATEQVLSSSRRVPEPANITSPERHVFEIPQPMIDIFGNAGLPSFATPLLRYYRSEVLGNSNLEEHARISPWRQLLLPSALETFAELSLWATTTHARRSILSTVLAKSAFHLHQAEAGKRDPSSHWLRVARGHNSDALEHLNISLRNELVGHNQAPYAEILMAVLSLVVVTVSAGSCSGDESVCNNATLMLVGVFQWNSIRQRTIAARREANPPPRTSRK